MYHPDEPKSRSLCAFQLLPNCFFVISPKAVFIDTISAHSQKLLERSPDLVRFKLDQYIRQTDQGNYKVNSLGSPTENDLYSIVRSNLRLLHFYCYEF